MAADITVIIKAISDINNRYRDSSISTRMKLEALWEMGDLLGKLGVTKPHTIGWAVQRGTKGLIKRPTIFRSHKIRTIWSSKEKLLEDLGGLQGLSSLTELLPLIDPAQDVKHKLSPEQLNSLFKHACSEPPGDFKRYLCTVKKRFSHGKLGKPLDKAKHLTLLQDIVSDFRALRTFLCYLFDEGSAAERLEFRAHTSTNELRSFSNMCIALTTKDNYRLYKRLSPVLPSSLNKEFSNLYVRLKSLLDKSADIERARLRRLISAEAMAEMSDMVSSMNSEESLEDFKERRKLAIPL
jgi:hypothetical protein